MYGAHIQGGKTVQNEQKYATWCSIKCKIKFSKLVMYNTEISLYQTTYIKCIQILGITPKNVINISMKKFYDQSSIAFHCGCKM